MQLPTCQVFEGYFLVVQICIKNKEAFVTVQVKTGIVIPGNDCGKSRFKSFNKYNQLLLMLNRLTLVCRIGLINLLNLLAKLRNCY